MLFLSSARFYAIFRLNKVLSTEYVQAHCWDIEEGRFIVFGLLWDAISSDVGAELALTLLDPSSYAPSDEEFKQWIAANAYRLHGTK